MAHAPRPAQLRRSVTLLLWLPLVLGGHSLAFAQGGPPVFSVQVGQVREATLAQSVEFVGSLQPWRTIDLSAEVEGRVDAIPIEEGQWLKEGDLVCRIDPEATEIEVQRAGAELARAEAELRRLRSGYRAEEVEQARKQLDRDQARLRAAQDEWERNRTLVEQGIVPAGEGTRLESLFREARAAVEQSEANLRQLAAGYRPEEIDVAQAEVDRQAAVLRDAERRLRRHTIVVSSACAVVERLKEPGEWADVGDAVAQLVVLDPLKVRIDVPQRYLTQVHLGLEAEIQVDGMPGRTFSARVDRIVPSAGRATRNFPVLMRLENPDHSLSSGLFARVQLKLGQERPTMIVPREAVLVRGDQLVLLVADPPSTGNPNAGEPPADQAAPPDALIRELVVRTGTELDGWTAVEVLEGGELRRGDRVVTLGGTRLVSGMPVKIIGTAPAGATAAAQPASAP